MSKLAKYTPEERREILKFSDTHGINEAIDKYGVKRGTLNIWRSRPSRQKIETMKPLGDRRWDRENREKRMRMKAERQMKAKRLVMQAAKKEMRLFPEFPSPTEATQDTYRTGFRDGFREAIALIGSEVE